MKSEGEKRDERFFSEATIGWILVALLIAYLSTIYAAFSRREAAVTMLEVRAGSPSSAVEMIQRHHRLQRLEQPGKEVDAVCDELAEAGVPLKPDREQAWRDFAGWRVNYETVLIALAELVMAPPAPWSSDRRLAYAPVVSLRWSRRKLVEKHEWIPPSRV